MEELDQTQLQKPIIPTSPIWGNPQLPAESPKKNTLTTEDWRKWTQETIIYNVTPLVLVLLQTLQSSYMAHGGLPTGSDLTIAAGASYGALLAAGINILGKFKSGN